MHCVLLLLSLWVPLPDADSAAVSAIIEEYQGSFSKWVKRISTETDPTKRQALIEERPRPDDYAPRLFELLATFPPGDATFLALRWTYIETREESSRNRALKRLLRDHVRETRITTLLHALEHDGEPRALEAIETITGQTPHRAVEGEALMSIATWLLAHRDAERARAEGILERVISEFAGAKASDGRTLDEVAKARLFEAQRLLVGKTAPEITGRDLEGVDFALSDYRGKVVLLPFWAHW